MSSNNYDILPKSNLQYFLNKLKAKFLKKDDLITLTQSQYDALSYAEKHDSSKYYYVKDAEMTGAVIDDTTTASDKVWSSNKVNSEVTEIYASFNSMTFARLADTNFSNLSNKQVPKYNATTQKWENEDESGSKTFQGTKAEWDALTAQEKAEYDGCPVIITNDYDSGAGIDDSTTALDKVWSSSKVSTELSGKADTSDLPILTSEVTALTGATSCTITNANIHTTSKLIEPKASVQGLAQPTMTITEGQCLLEFPALAQDTSFGLLIYN